MKVDLLNRLRRVVASALVALTAGLALGPLLHAETGHDRDCDPLVVIHDASQHAFGPARPAPFDDLPAAHDHCVTCHLFRISRLSQEASPVPAGDHASSTLTAPAENFRLSDPASIPLPARAPPAP